MRVSFPGPKAGFLPILSTPWYDRLTAGEELRREQERSTMSMISTRGRYALRIMLDLAEHQGEEGYLPLKEVAERQEISEKYLESIVKSLVQAKILKGSRGKGGGYRLVRPPEECTLGSILRLTEGDLAPVSCLEEGGVNCEKAQECPTLPTWVKLNGMIQQFLDSVSLSDLMEPAAGSAPSPQASEA